MHGACPAATPRKASQRAPGSALSVRPASRRDQRAAPYQRPALAPRYEALRSLSALPPSLRQRVRPRLLRVHPAPQIRGFPACPDNVRVCLAPPCARIPPGPRENPPRTYTARKPALERCRDFQEIRPEIRPKIRPEIRPRFAARFRLRDNARAELAAWFLATDTQPGTPPAR